MSKILYIITQGELGGAQRYVLDLATKIADTRRSSASGNTLIHAKNTNQNQAMAGYEILVAVGEGGGELKSRLEKNNIPVIVARHLRRNIHPLRDILAVFELKKIIRDWRPDMVHLNSSKAGVVGTFGAKLAGIKNIIFTAHGFAFLEPSNWIVRQIYFWAEKVASYFRRKIITVSEFDRQAAIKARLCPPEKLITIHNGITPPVIASTEATEVRGNPNEIASSQTPRNDRKIVIGTIARDYPTKDLATLKQAFDLVKAVRPNAELQIVSNMPDASEKLAEFDIYSCSSVKEGFPYSILEAMAQGLPIVSTNVGGIPEAIENNIEGLLVKPKNPKLLAEGIIRFIKNPELAERLGKKAQEKVKEFTLDKMAGQTEAEYRRLITDNS